MLRLSGHSLRAGFVTEAKKRGADDAAIMDQTGHKSVAMVHRYHRRSKKWENQQVQSSVSDLYCNAPSMKGPPATEHLAGC
jgi:integrase